MTSRYLFTHDGRATMCKHGSRLVELGLVPAPTPIPGTLGRREFPSPTVSALRDDFPGRSYHPATRVRRFEPSPEEMAEAAQLFGDLAAGRMACQRDPAAAL